MAVHETKLTECPLDHSYFKQGFTLGIDVEKLDEGDERRIIAGYASVEVIDRQNEIITLDALRDAYSRFIKSDFPVCSALHSNFIVGKVIDEYKDKNGKVWKSGVDDTGLMIVTEIRKDVKMADEVWNSIQSGKLKAYSIGGQALIKVPVCDSDRCHWRIDKLDIHEIALVDRPANQGSSFIVLKRDSPPLVKIAEFLGRMPHMVLFKDYISVVGSTVEKGEGNDIDILIRDSSDSPLRRHIETRFLKQAPDVAGALHFIWGDPQGPHDTHIPLYDLVLLRRHPKKVVMDLQALEGDEHSTLDKSSPASSPAPSLAPASPVPASPPSPDPSPTPAPTSTPAPDVPTPSPQPTDLPTLITQDSMSLIEHKVNTMTEPQAHGDAKEQPTPDITKTDAPPMENRSAPSEPNVQVTEKSAEDQPSPILLEIKAMLTKFDERLKSVEEALLKLKKPEEKPYEAYPPKPDTKKADESTEVKKRSPSVHSLTPAVPYEDELRALAQTAWSEIHKKARGE